MTPRILPAIAGLALVLVALSACTSPSPSTTSPTPTESAAQGDTSTAPTTSPSSEGPPEGLSCESMISARTVAALSDAGWSAETKEFVVGGVELPEGLLCFWADYTVGSDNGQLYGWSSISSADAKVAEQALLDEGWTREDGSDGIYVTEDIEYSMGTDEDGYGMTYLFGDGWVRLADTRQGLILIEWPR